MSLFRSPDDLRAADEAASALRREQLIGGTFNQPVGDIFAQINIDPKKRSGDLFFNPPDPVETLSANDLARLQARGAIQSSPLLSQEIEFAQRQEFYDKLDPRSPVYDPKIQDPPPVPPSQPVVELTQDSPEIQEYIKDVLKDLPDRPPSEDIIAPNPLTFDPVDLFDFLKRSNFVQPEPGMNPRNVVRELTDPFNLAQQQQKTAMQQQMMFAAQSPQQYAFDVGTGQQVGGIASLGVDQPQSLDALYDSIVDEKGYTGSYNSPPLTSPYTGQGPIGSLRYYTG